MIIRSQRQHSNKLYVEPCENVEILLGTQKYIQFWVCGTNAIGNPPIYYLFSVILTIANNNWWVQYPIQYIWHMPY